MNSISARRSRFAFALLAFAALLLVPGGAGAHGGEGAHAKKPVIKRGPLRLAGVGTFGTARPHQQVRITVCLEKRYSGEFVAVRCNSKTSGRDTVTARVNVPGCVRGVWRTTVVGDALNASGDSRHGASDTSRAYRC